MPAQLIDLSHTIRHGLRTYKGIPAPMICDSLSREGSRQSYEAGTEFHIARMDMVANTGTYLDCPLHRKSLGTRAGTDAMLNLDENVEGQ